MFEFLKKSSAKKNGDKSKKVEQKIESINKPLEGKPLQLSLDDNMNKIKELFKDVDIFKTRYIVNQHDSSLRIYIAYLDGMINSTLMNDSVIKPLVLAELQSADKKDLIDTLMNSVLQTNEMEKTSDLKKIVEAISYGDTVLFADGCDEAAILNTKHFSVRSIQEPDSEKNLSGPREGFNESLVSNLSLIRRKVKTNELKMKFFTFGRRTRTSVCVSYLEGIVNKRLLKELYARLEKIDIDAVLDSNYLTELIRDDKMSPFRTTGYTERPDVVVGRLLEGRIAVFVDGSPVVLTVPYLFIENFQSSEDYYLNFYYTSFSRMLRMVGFFLTITVPAAYVAIVAFHHEMMPTPLLINIASERQSVPLPAAVEAFIMLLTFDILRETGVRMPSNVGQALSIVGALVIGQAAVEAKLVASPMIIVVAITGITSLLVPKMNAPVIYLRFGLLAVASMFGLFGLFLGLCGILVHTLNLTSLGVPQIRMTGGYRFQDNKDIFFRAPWWKMVLRTRQLATNPVRMRAADENEDD